jgi:hypothetical protein
MKRLAWLVSSCVAVPRAKDGLWCVDNTMVLSASAVSTTFIFLGRFAKALAIQRGRMPAASQSLTV